MDNQNLNKFFNLLFYFSILAFIIAFNFAHNPPSGWYQQFLPNIGNRNIVDITFLDSLNGYSISSIASDTSLILKTTDGGNNWWIANRQNSFIMTSIEFIDERTGFVGGTNLIRTTDSGISWNTIYPFLFSNDLSFINQDTGWYVDSEGLLGGVFRTTNGGMNWTQQVNLSGNNPTNIYFYNKDTGFTASTVLYKTTNSGVNWFLIPGGGFGDMYFINATTGWKCYGPIQKTTDGGNSWQTLPLPPKSDTLPLSRVISFSNVSADTIWGVGSVGVFGSIGRGLIYISTNGGLNWNYQLPDTAINIFIYEHTQFINKLIGWAYGVGSGVHTVTGGDTTITSIIKQSVEIPKNYELHQNYPNPFNPMTTIDYKLRIRSEIKLNLFDATGKEVKVLVNKLNQPGIYNITFDAGSLPSGVYFYSLFIDGVIAETKKMVLVR